jgi:RimJ/RimL family protein N-acetyltransferase
MAFFPALLKRHESDALAKKIRSLIEQRGWGFWAVALKHGGPFIGFVGLHTPINLPFSPCVEIGWRLSAGHWGKGYASEAARGALQVGFEQLQFTQIVAFTAAGNGRSRRVMERLGMAYSGGFAHPDLPADSLLQAHVLYRLHREHFIHPPA